MRIIGPLFGDIKSNAGRVQVLEELGYDCATTAEINNDPFLPLVLAAEHSNNIELTTNIAVAFARNPMTIAQTAHDLNEYANGRISIGLGSQIQAHIEKRFSMPWSKPASRMREFILAIKAIWDTWQNGTPLKFRGDFYQHTLMTPVFHPSSKEFAPPKIRLAGVGPRMTEVAGEVAEGLIAHGFTTEKYLEEVTMPAVKKGLDKAGKSKDDFEIFSPIMVATGLNEESYKQNIEAVRGQISFYASTPAYTGVLELHGWGDLQKELNTLSKEGKWLEMGGLIDDEILNTFAIISEDINKVPALMKERYGKYIDGWICTTVLNDTEAEGRIN